MIARVFFGGRRIEAITAVGAVECACGGYAAVSAIPEAFKVVVDVITGVVTHSSYVTAAEGERGEIDTLSILTALLCIACRLDDDIVPDTLAGDTEPISGVCAGGGVIVDARRVWGKAGDVIEHTGVVVGIAEAVLARLTVATGCTYCLVGALASLADAGGGVGDRLAFITVTAGRVIADDTVTGGRGTACTAVPGIFFTE